MSFVIKGLATALPPHSISQAQAGEMAVERCHANDRQLKLLPTLYRRTGIQKRHSTLIESNGGEVFQLSFYPAAESANCAGPGTAARMQRFEKDALPLAIEACRGALTEAGLPPDRVTHIITVSCSGFAAPGVDIALIRELHLSPRTERINVGFMGCHGAINGLRAANAIAGADPDAVILMCCVELCSLHFQYGWDPEQIVANAIFSDGAAAVVGGATRHERPWRVRATGSCVFPGSEDAMTWKIGDNGFQMSLSAAVPDLIGQRLKPFLEDWLGARGLSISDIRSWVVHPGGPRILRATEEALSLSEEDTRESWNVLQSCGNMSSPTVLFILQKMKKGGAKPPCVMLAFGPGLTAEVALIV